MHPTRHSSSLFVSLTIWLICVVGLAWNAGTPVKAAPQPVRFVPGQALVQFRPGKSVAERAQVLSAAGARLVRPLLMPGYALVAFAPQSDVGQVTAALANQADILLAEPNYYYRAAAIPNDPFYSVQWNLRKIQMEQAWELANGDGVVVAVLDTGIAYEDFGTYSRSPDFSATRFVSGYNFISDTIHANDDDTSGHGTHVAGTIGEDTNNNIGAAGIAYRARLMPVKVLDSDRVGTTDVVADGITWAMQHGARVINLSLGGPDRSAILEAAINTAVDSGVVVVAASGNVSRDFVDYPAGFDKVIAVGATRFDNTLTSYSNYGEGQTLVAPGGDLSVDQDGDGQPDGIWQMTYDTPFANFGTFAVRPFQGTSMAAAHVSGVAALLLAHGNVRTPAQVREALVNTALDLGDAGRDNKYGAGLMQARAALEYNLAPTSPTPTRTPTPTLAPGQPTPTFTATGTAGTPTTTPTTTPAGPAATFTPLPTVTNTPTPTATPEPPTRVYLAPAFQTGFLAQRTPVTVTVGVTDVVGLAGFQADVSYDPAVLRFVSMTLQTFVTSTGRIVTSLDPVTSTAGAVTFGYYSFGSAPGVSGSGPIAVLSFLPVNSGRTDLLLHNVRLVNASDDLIPNATRSAEVRVLACIQGDFNCDCKVDVVDLVAIGRRFGTIIGDSLYDNRFDLDDNGRIDLFDVVRVSTNWGATCPRQLAFISERGDTNERKVWTMWSDGTEPQLIINGPAAAPTWNADHTLLAFSRQDGDANARYHIWVVEPSGSNPRQLTFGNFSDTHPTWSADGRFLAFASDRTGDWDIFIMDADGANVRNLTQAPLASDSDPHWSHDGRLIAFSSNRTGNSDIWISEPSGRNPVNLTRTPSSEDYDPIWSPDDLYLAYTSQRAADNEIYVMTFDGRNPRNLTNAPSDERAPAWSPDGKQIAFATDRESQPGYPNWEIYVMDTDGSRQHNITNDPSWDGEPAW
ncbi:MAG: S8 family serine peptidase [Chloroflexi bacterium]|nr:S8 family serine peptidase [Chloroflexota bacterium]